MDKPISPLTCKIIAFSEITEADNNEAIDWALEMMELGYESTSLFMLASFTKPVLYYEIADYLNATLKELKIPTKTGEAAIISYSSYYIDKIATGENVRLNLGIGYYLCQKHNYEGILYDFYLLHWAWDDIDYGSIEYNPYWEGATIDNIEQIVIGTAKKWLIENKEFYVVSFLEK